MSDIHKLRDILFRQLENLQASEGKTTAEQQLAIDHANANTGIAKAILDSVKVEHAFMKMMERRKPLTEFIPIDHEGSIHTVEHAAKMAALKREEWKANNPEKIRHLKQSNE